MKTVNENQVNAEIAKTERMTELKEREVALKERELDALVRKQADAEKYAAEVKAQAEKQVAIEMAEADKEKAIDEETIIRFSLYFRLGDPNNVISDKQKKIMDSCEYIVYDNRAEMVQYDPDGNGREVKFKPFSYPDMVHNNGMPKKVSGSIEITKP